MSSGTMPPVPPSLAAAGARASMQAVAVRLIDVPSGLQNNSQPVRLRGQVVDSGGAGNVTVATDRGLVTIALKDSRQGLPTGLLIEIDIPAGRAPSLGAIRPSSEWQASGAGVQSSPPTLSASLPHPEAVSLSRESSVPGLATESLETIFSALQSGEIEGAPFPKVALDLGSLIRLVALPTLAGAPGSGASSLSASSLGSVLSLLEGIIQKEGAVGSPVLKETLFSILSQLSASSGDGVAGRAFQTLLSKFNISPQSVDFKNISGPHSFLSVQGDVASLDVRVVGLFSPFAPAGDVFAGGGSGDGVFSIGDNFFVSNQYIKSVSSGPASDSASLLLAQIVGVTDENFPVFSVAGPWSAGAGKSFLFPLPVGTLFPSVWPMGAGDSLSDGAGLDVLPFPVSVMLSVEGAVEAPVDPKNPVWRNFQELLSLSVPLLADGAGGFGRHDMLPSPAHPAQMPALAQLFLSLVQSGDLRSWLSPDLYANLRKDAKRSDLIDKFLAELGAMRGGIPATLSGATAPSSPSAPVGFDWRVMYLPFAFGQDIRKVPLYYKEMDGDSEAETKDRQRRLRFLFDLHLSRMGDVQIDGFLQQPRLDLVVRTKTPLSVSMQSRMKQLYAGAVEKSNMTGELGFQSKPEQWVDFSISSVDDQVIEG